MKVVRYPHHFSSDFGSRRCLLAHVAAGEKIHPRVVTLPSGTFSESEQLVFFCVTTPDPPPLPDFCLVANFLRLRVKNWN